MPSSAPPKVTLRPAEMADYALIEAWLRQGEVQRWWGSLSVAQASVILALQEPLGLCSLICADGVPVGYIQALEDASLALAGAYRIDSFVGEPAARGRGIGRAALELATDEVFQTTLATMICGLVPLRNEAAVRIFERARFRWQRVVEDPALGRCWLMQRERGC